MKVLVLGVLWDPLSLALLLVIAASFGLSYLVYSYDHGHPHLRGPGSWWPIGNLPEIGRKGYHVCQLEWMRKYGPVYRYYMGRQKVVAVCDPEMVREICVRQFKAFHDRPLPPYLTEESTRGLIFGRGTYWAGVRNALTPMFHAAQLRRFAGDMHRGVDALLVALRALPPGAPIDILARLEALALDIMGAVAFGIDFGMQKEGADVAFARAYAENELESGRARLSTVLVLLFPLLRTPLQWLLAALPFTAESRIRRRLAYMYGKCQAIVEQRRADPAAQPPGPDLLTFLTSARDKDTGVALTDRDIRMLVFGLLGAGSGTTANTVAFAVHLLSQNAPAEEKLAAEVDAWFERRATGDGGSPGRGDGGGGGDAAWPSYEELEQFPYAEQVVLETLRLYPTGALLAREAGADAAVCGVRFCRGTIVLVPVYALHRAEGSYAAPGAFRPERFDPACEEARARPAGAYAPFGLGPRACIGQRFALEEVKLVLVALYRNFTFRAAPGGGGGGGELALSAGLNLKPRHGVHVSVHPRSPSGGGAAAGEALAAGQS